MGEMADNELIVELEDENKRLRSRVKMLEASEKRLARTLALVPPKYVPVSTPDFFAKKKWGDRR